MLTWFRSTFFGADEEPGAELVEQGMKDAVNAGKTATEFLDKVFGKDRFKENAKNVAKDKDLPIKDRFTSVVLPTWKRTCKE